MILLDAGNIFAERPLTESAREASFWRAELILTAMERMGYEAAGLGEMDLYLGLDRLIALNELTGIPFVSANLVDGSGEPVFVPYVTIQAGDLRVLVLGLTQPPAGPDLAAGNLGDFSVLDPIDTAMRLVPEVRSGCDLLIVLSSMGHSRDLDLARIVDGIDIIIGGGSRRYTRKAVIADNTLLTSGYFQGRAIGQLMLSFKGHAKGWISSQKLGFLDHQIRIAEEQEPTAKRRRILEDLTAQRESAAGKTVYISDMISLDPSFPDDQEIASMVLEYRRELNRAAFMPRGGVADQENPTRFSGPQACVQCHESRQRFWAGTRHARAFKTLQARGAGEDPDCLPCHVTGFGQATGYRPESEMGDLGGVTCESCHGIGSLHVMSPELYDLVAAPAPSVCTKCHNDERDDYFDYMRDQGKVCSEETPGKIVSEHVSE